MRQACPILAETDQVGRASWEDFGEPGPVDPTPFAYAIKDFYRTDPISRASETMAQCSAISLPLQRQLAPARTGTLG
jgi:NADH-quinone oxidoreductase subunit G